MSIERDFLNGPGDFPILFHVSESFQAWDGQAALVLDHLLNHIKVLHDIAEGAVNQPVLEALAHYPQYKLDSVHYITPANRQAISDKLIDECLILLKCLAKITPIMEITAAQRNRLLEIISARVPFLDYQYIGDTSTSDAQRED